MGGDHGPAVTVPAVMDALEREADLRVVLVGLGDAIRQHLKDSSADADGRLTIKEATQVVSMTAGRTTGAPRTSAWNCMRSWLATMPPSTLSVVSGTPESAFMASTTSRTCQATASSTERSLARAPCSTGA